MNFTGAPHIALSGDVADCLLITATSGQEVNARADVQQKHWWRVCKNLCLRIDTNPPGPDGDPEFGVEAAMPEPATDAPAILTL
jgi:hypothetical protein